MCSKGIARSAEAVELWKQDWYVKTVNSNILYDLKAISTKDEK